MTALVVAAALLFWVCVFMTYFASVGTTPAQFFFGRYEDVPEHLGKWRQLDVEPASGVTREERLILPHGSATASYLLLQVRFRDSITGAILRVEPERRIARRRVTTRSRA